MSNSTAPIGLISAIPQEIQHFGNDFREKESADIGGYAFRSGTLAGVSVVLVEAGIGKVNTGVVATVLLHSFGCRALVFSGVAGGLDPALGIGDVVIANRLVQHDYGALIDGTIVAYQPGVPPLPHLPRDHGYDLPADLEKRLHGALDDIDLPVVSAQATGDTARKPHLLFGTVLSGDQFINCEVTRVRLHTTFKAQAAEMEGAALAQVCERFGAPWVVVRSLSDLAGAESHLDFGAFLEEAAGGAAEVVRRILPVV